METSRATVPMPSDTRGKIDTALENKEKGNEFFKAGSFKKAVQKYSTALAYTKVLWLYCYAP